MSTAVFLSFLLTLCLTVHVCSGVVLISIEEGGEGPLVNGAKTTECVLYLAVTGMFNLRSISQRCSCGT